MYRRTYRKTKKSLHLCYFNEPPPPVLLHVQVESFGLDLEHLGGELLLTRLPRP
jgi:hypothetical protein